MKVGDLVKWSWALGADHWERTTFTGVIFSSRLAKTDKEKIMLYRVLVSDGLVTEIREDLPDLKVIA